MIDETIRSTKRVPHLSPVVSIESRSSSSPTHFLSQAIFPAVTIDIARLERGGTAVQKVRECLTICFQNKNRLFIDFPIQFRLLLSNRFVQFVRPIKYNGHTYTTEARSMGKVKSKFVVTCSHGFEPFLHKELSRLNIQKLKSGNGSVQFPLEHYRMDIRRCFGVDWGVEC